MLILTYDGSFEGLLTLVYDCYYEKLTPDDIQVAGEKEQDFLSRYINIETDEEKADKVYSGIEKKISPEALKNCYHGFLSDEEHRHLIIYRYIRFGFKKGAKVDSYLAKDTVRALHSLTGKVQRERHRMLGLARFMELEEGVLYAKIQPKYNILSLIAPHFANRLGPERWMIHDVARNLLVIGTNGNWLLRDYNLGDDLRLHKREARFQSLWKEFHQSIAIKDRKNLKLQQQFMPKRYWKNLTEMQGEIRPKTEKERN